MITICPFCGVTHDAISGMNAHVPSEGDISICFDCGNPSVFDSALDLHKMSEEDMKQLPPQVVLLSNKIKKARGNEHGKNTTSNTSQTKLH